MFVKNFINGEFYESESGATLAIINPATNEEYGRCVASQKQDIDTAVQAAEQAFVEWSTTPPPQRAKYLKLIAQKLIERVDQFAMAESRNTGKLLSFSKSVDIPRSATNFDFFAEALQQFQGESHPMGTMGFNVTHRESLGVVACISPWNLPLYLFTWKIAPALAMGNCVVGKPSELTPVTAFMLAEIAAEIRLPPGVLNIVHGYGAEAGQALVQHPQVKAVSFTGGTKTGKQIAQQAAPLLKKVSLELGGKNPCIVFADSAWKKNIDTIVRSAYANQGQICLCMSRVLVEESIYEEFKEAFIPLVKDLSVGDPSDLDSKQGALISKAQLEKVKGYLNLARADGGVLHGYERDLNLSESFKKGNFIPPVVLEGLSSDHRCNQEEIFGPVSSLIPFKDKEDALSIANNSSYGLCSSVWNNNLDECMELVRKLQVGMVWLNSWMVRDLRTPFGGYKESGLGREGGYEALRFFSQAKNVYIPTSS